MDLVVLSEDGCESQVSVERVAGAYVVEIGGRRFEVDWVRVGGVQRSLLIGGRQALVSVSRDKPGRYRVSSRAGEVMLEVRDPLDHLVRSAASSHEGNQSVVAYMPGRVLAVLVAEGEAVEVGQGILVLEAMKMENEIPTEVAGVVKEIFAEVGQSVEGGDPLFEIEPS